jgi:hypothetical protein
MKRNGMTANPVSNRFRFSNLMQYHAFEIAGSNPVGIAELDSLMIMSSSCLFYFQPTAVTSAVAEST